MELMSRAVVKTRTLKPLPGEITTAAINNATLPVKIEAARRAIAECSELPELLLYKSQAEGLAAAVRTIKEVGPEMIRAANCLVAEAWRKGGELLKRYSSASTEQHHPITNKANGRIESSRRAVARELGLSRQEMVALVRIAEAPESAVFDGIQKTKNLETLSKRMPLVRKIINKTYSDTLRLIISGSTTGVNTGGGLTRAKSALSYIPLDSFKHLTSDERKIVKAKITEIMELLDEMDRLCK